MYIFGNSECLLNYKGGCDDQSKLWKDVIMYLKNKSFIGKELQLKCNNHKNTTVIKEPEDFKKVPEGGCKLQCESRLPCGHKCESLCHYFEISQEDPTGHKI